MSSARKMSEADYNVIVAFIQPQLQSMSDHLDRIGPLVKKDSSGLLKAQYAYQRNYCSTCRHLLGLARQKVGVKKDVLTRNPGDVK